MEEGGAGGGRRWVQEGQGLGGKVKVQRAIHMIYIKH